SWLHHRAPMSHEGHDRAETGGGPITDHRRAQEGRLESGSRASPRRMPELTLYPLALRVIQTRQVQATLSLQPSEASRSTSSKRNEGADEDSVVVIGLRS